MAVEIFYNDVNVSDDYYENKGDENAEKNSKGNI